MSQKQSHPHSARSIAWACLKRWARGGSFAESLITQASRDHAISPADRAMVQSIVYTTLRHKTWLEFVSTRLRQGKLESGYRWLIISALAQLYILDMPAYAVVNETVKITPRPVRGLINGVLRTALREKDKMLRQRSTLSLSAQYSTPQWIIDSWIRQWGRSETIDLLKWNLQSSSVYARLNPLNPPASIPESWEALPDLAQWYRITDKLPKEALEQGRVYVADPSTRHCIDLLAPQAGERLLDACAAPGGKSIAMIHATGGELDLLATDLREHRLAPLRENILKSGVEQVSVAAHDWTQSPPEAWLESFDGVLIDLPCSNTGVFQRRVDARWRLTPEELTRLADLQLDIATQAAKAVRPGGRLVYSTCSIEDKENQDNVARFLEAHPQFELVKSHLALPHREQADGAYAALLRRTIS